MSQVDSKPQQIQRMVDPGGLRDVKINGGPDSGFRRLKWMGLGLLVLLAVMGYLMASYWIGNAVRMTINQKTAFLRLQIPDLNAPKWQAGLFKSSAVITMGDPSNPPLKLRLAIEHFPVWQKSHWFSTARLVGKAELSEVLRKQVEASFVEAPRLDIRGQVFLDGSGTVMAKATPLRSKKQLSNTDRLMMFIDQGMKFRMDFNKHHQPSFTELIVPSIKLLNLTEVKSAKAQQLRFYLGIGEDKASDQISFVTSMRDFVMVSRDTQKPHFRIKQSTLKIGLSNMLLLVRMAGPLIRGKLPKQAAAAAIQRMERILKKGRVKLGFNIDFSDGKLKLSGSLVFMQMPRTIDAMGVMESLKGALDLSLPKANLGGFDPGMVAYIQKLTKDGLFYDRGSHLRSTIELDQGAVLMNGKIAR